MAESTATPGFGCTARWGASTTPIPEVVAINGPGISREAIDVTHLSSDSMCKEFIAGVIDGGEVSLDLNLLPDDTNQSVLFASMISTVASCAKRALAVTLSNATAETISMAGAVITNWESTGAVEGKLGASVTFKVSGAVSMA